MSSASNVLLLSLMEMEFTSSQLWSMNIKYCKPYQVARQTGWFKGRFISEFVLPSISYFLFKQIIRLPRQMYTYFGVIFWMQTKYFSYFQARVNSHVES